MFSINIYLRFALIAVTILGGIALSVAFGFWYGFPFVLVGLILLAGYFALGTVQSAAMIMQSGDLEGAEKRLGLTLFPNWLYVTNRAYFYMIKGSIAIAQKKNDEGERYLKIAQSIKVPTDNEKGMIELQLASINANKGKWKEAEYHYRKLKELKITEQAIKEQMKEFDKAFQNRGQVKAASRMGAGQMMVRPGSKSKRKRPKMR
jgi:tetratricopeptide (TPR) repeat protein